MNDRALIIDADRTLPAELSELLHSRGIQVDLAESQPEALDSLAAQPYQYIFYNIPTSVDFGQRLLEELWTRAPRFTQIFATGPANVAVAVHAMQSGARHYWPLPLDLSDVENHISSGSAQTNRSRLGYHREGTLLQIIKEIALTMELDGLANILIDSAMELTAADGGALFLLDEKSNLLVMKAIRGFSITYPASEYFGLSEEKYYDILQKRKPLFLQPVDPPIFAANRKAVRDMILAPIWCKDQPLGMIVVVKFETPSLSNDDFKLITLLSDEISGAVYNAIIHYKTKELTIKDDLTEAYNRRYFERYLEEEFLRARRYNSNLSLIFFDVDNLKDVNVKHGHLIGSKMLQEIAHRMILTVRGIDKVVRYGGDEFCVVLPETDTQGAYQVADRIRNIVASRPFRINETTQVNLTGSIGIASFPIHATSKDELIRQADRAMFVIKNKSKNGIAVADLVPPDTIG